MDEEELIEKLAAEIVGYHDRLRAVVKDLPDEDVVKLVQACKRNAQPNETHNFHMPVWDAVAEQIENELHVRSIFRRAEEHEKKTGSPYCVHCDGDCTPEHIAEMKD